MPIKVRILRTGSHSKDIPVPKYMTPHAAGMDIYAACTQDLTLNPGERKLIPTGFSIELPKGFEAQIRPRSGLALKYGVTCLNSPGTIDADYRGEIQILLINHGAELFVIQRGDRIAQMVIQEVDQIVWEEVTTLEASQRQIGGFGSTGK